VSDIVAEISAASAGTEHGHRARSTRPSCPDGRATQQNAALVEQASAAAESLQEQAATLVALVGEFRLSADEASAARPDSGASQARRPVGHTGRKLLRAP
jgi:methyl-accepting chemotaxis protein